MPSIELIIDKIDRYLKTERVLKFRLIVRHIGIINDGCKLQSVVGLLHNTNGM